MLITRFRYKIQRSEVKGFTTNAGLRTQVLCTTRNTGHVHNARATQVRGQNFYMLVSRFIISYDDVHN